MAIRVLKARLLERALEEQEAEVRKLKGEHVEAGWGNQIRSYVLHPYQMVKDLRTNHETGNTQAVLDGDLDDFMQAELERLATGGAPAAARPRPPRRRASGRPGDPCVLDRARRRPDPGPHVVRPARPDELAICAGIWRDALNDYLGRLGQPEIPDDLAPILRLYAHLQATDPETFLVADRDGRVDGFIVALAAGERCGSCRCCSSGPAPRPAGWAASSSPRSRRGDGWTGARATATDSAQPISNGLYALARDRAAGPAPAPRRPGRSTGRAAAAARRDRGAPVRRGGRRRGRPAAGRARRRAGGPRPGRGRASTAPWTAPFLALEARAGLPVPRTATAASSATATPPSRAGSVRSPFATRRSWRR